MSNVVTAIVGYDRKDFLLPDELTEFEAFLASTPGSPDSWLNSFPVGTVLQAPPEEGFAHAIRTDHMDGLTNAEGHIFFNPEWLVVDAYGPEHRVRWHEVQHWAPVHIPGKDTVVGLTSKVFENTPESHSLPEATTPVVRTVARRTDLRSVETMDPENDVYAHTTKCVSRAKLVYTATPVTSFTWDAGPYIYDPTSTVVKEGNRISILPTQVVLRDFATVLFPLPGKHGTGSTST